ncbi:four-carbon acid sugar kinase family protein [Scopulibacillus cellulosilyticus]|uniref:Four-carbon acid sugar kinase family protein n=1 Tax=Scopulibacillus cellulosilyticus TaxID=2665665 RepID=A0ABW2Q3U3_9BACL
MNVIFQSMYKEIMDNHGETLEYPLRKDIAKKLKQNNHKLIVLDDDPTGVQTVHDVYVITSWDKKWLREGLSDDKNVLYILTNTRSFGPEQTKKINQEIIRNIVEVSKELSIDFSIISRSDSTLRGHYPLEISVIEETLSEELNWEISGHLLIPAFFEGKRYTFDNTHYIVDGQKLVAVSETEFANDSVFGFSTAYLPKWVMEKTEGEISAEDVLTISIDDIRQGGIDKVTEILLSAEKNTPIVVNAANYNDLDIVSLAVLKALGCGKRFLFRTAASFVKSIGGIEDKPLLSASEMIAKNNEDRYGGLLVVGSHTKKTTDQLSDLISEIHVRPIEINVEKILNPLNKQEELTRVCKLLEQSILDGEDTVVYTSRKVIKADSKHENLQYSQKISNTLVDIVRSLKVTPKFIMAKGGITSSDVATQGLEIKKAKILGQAAAGVPVLLTGEEARLKNIPYIVFPGNVGDKNTITSIIRKIHQLKER